MAKSEIRNIDIIVDLEADPFVPDGWEVVQHKKSGKLNFDPNLFKLYLDNGQMGLSYVWGLELRKRLVDKPVVNANLLDWCLAHPEFIPEEWKMGGKGSVPFWGTIYAIPAEGGLPNHFVLGVRCLYWRGEWIGGHWKLADHPGRSCTPALIFA